MPQHQRILIWKIGAFRNLFFQKSTNFNCKYFYKGVNLEKIWVDFSNPWKIIWLNVDFNFDLNHLLLAVNQLKK